MIAAILLKSEQTSILTTTFLVLGFFLFSDSVAPLETMPELAAFFASKNPFVLATLAFKKIIVFGIAELASREIIFLSFYLLVIITALLLVSQIRLKKH